MNSRTILVCAAMKDQDGCYAAMKLLEMKKREGVRILSGLEPPPHGIDWPAVRNAEGGWEGAYAWAARAHDGFCLVPVDGRDGLSRGVFSIAEEAFKAGKSQNVLAFRAGALQRVHGLHVVNRDEYKGVYGRLVTEGQ